MSTTCESINDLNDVLSPDVVKVVIDENGFAMYFSRSPIPFPRDEVKKYSTLENALKNEPKLIKSFKKHTGLYVYRREFLLKYSEMPQSKSEKIEILEQLRVLDNGYKIKVVEVEESSIGVDTKEDFDRVKAKLESKEVFFIRRAKFEDIQQIARVHIESWQKSFRSLVPQKYLDNLLIEKREKAFRKGFFNYDYQMFVAETSENKIIGFADLGKGRDFQGQYEGEIYAIYTLKEFQGKGVGSELFRIGVETLRKNGFNSMFLQSLRISPYRKFYEKKGGKVIGLGIHKLGDEDFDTIYYGWEDLSKI
jgi:ribosomal protein S18 acetylase RimI-like enzyme